MSDSPRPAPVSFSEFEPLTTEAWQERIKRDLKGADPATLGWPTLEGFTVEPFYHREALVALGNTPVPLTRPRAATEAPNGWLNVPTVQVPANSDGHAQINHAVNALARGADGIHFDIDTTAQFDVGYLAARIPLGSAHLSYTVCRAPDELMQRLLAAAPGVQLRGFLRFAPGSGFEARQFTAYLGNMRRCVALARGQAEFRVLALNGSYFGNRGATATQQLAFSLSIGAALLHELPNEEVSLQDVAEALASHFSVETSYFPEMAKLRALRRLWATLLHAYGLPAETVARFRVHATSSSWTQTTLDPHTNMLRVTTEAMSAVLGGADTISVTPYDSLFAEDNESSARIARNVPIILREEAHLDRVADPAAGSYYLETLTDQLAREAWALFQRMEAAGGLPAARGAMLEEIRAVALEKFHRIATSQQVIVGTNRFQNPDEEFSFDPKALLRSRHFDATRAAYPTEVLRLATALHLIRKEQKKKKATMVLLGPDTIELIYDTFVRTLPPDARPHASALPGAEEWSLLFSSTDGATFMAATERQFRCFAKLIVEGDPDCDDNNYVPPVLLTADLHTMKEGIRIYGLREFSVQGYTTDEVLARLQGR